MVAKYLVSGGAGALGKLIVSMLLERGEKVRILMSELSDVSVYQNNPNVEICYGISTDKDSMVEFFDTEDPRHSVLIHADEYISLSDSTNLTMRRVNVIGAENICDMCLKRKIGRLVYLSSAYALNPEIAGEGAQLHFDRNKVEGEYAKSKAEAAAYIMEKIVMNRLNAVMVLPTFIIGPGYAEDYEINKVLNSYLTNGVTPIKGGGHAFVDVRDVANAMLTLATTGDAGSGYIISGEYKTSEQFFQEVNEVQGIDAPVKTASRLVMSKSLAKFVDAYYKITHKDNPKQVYALFSDNPQAKFEDTGKGVIPDNSVSFKASISDSINGVDENAKTVVDTKTSAEPKMTAFARAVQRNEARAQVSKPEAAPAPVAPAPEVKAEDKKEDGAN
ncbi:MAG: NAD-dependent epimerase/dehydratase family protein [Saccharofermentans sp.]|nr:NAD-dependent epimerase/dehydratase family protein [Saccharofermentans sp.]